MSKHTYNNIGRKLYQLRLELGLTQNDVAERCNMSVNYYGRIERRNATAALICWIRYCRCWERK